MNERMNEWMNHSPHSRSENGRSKWLQRRFVDSDEVNVVEEKRREGNGKHDGHEEEEEDVEPRHFSIGARRPEFDEILRDEGFVLY